MSHHNQRKYRRSQHRIQSIEKIAHAQMKQQKFSLLFMIQISIVAIFVNSKRRTGSIKLILIVPVKIFRHICFSSTLLQHVSSHIFNCSHCSFYTLSHHRFYEHLFDKHRPNVRSQSLSEPPFDLVYVRRYADGSLDLKRNKKASRKQNVRATRSIEHQRVQSSDVSMKHRDKFSTDQSDVIHSLTFDYQQRDLRKTLVKSKRFISMTLSSRPIDNIASCLKSLINEIVEIEENQ